MKLTLNPMPPLRKAAEDQINQYFSNVAAATLHRDLAHAAKRQLAAAILAGANPTPEFVEEAGLRGVEPLELANTIASKTDLSAARELSRQKMLLSVEAATTPAELQEILKAAPLF